MADYSGDKQSAYDDIKDAGIAVLLRTYVRSGYNGTTDSFTANRGSEYDTYAMMGRFKPGDIDGNIIGVGDQRILVPGLDLPVLTNDDIDHITVQIGEETTERNIGKNVEFVGPSNDPIIYFLTLKAN